MSFVKLYDRKNALVAAEMLNDKVVPWFEEQDVRILRMLTDRGTEYCGKRERHEYELYLSVEDIGHKRTKAKSPQTNGICERFHQIMQNEFYYTAFREKIYVSIERFQEDSEKWVKEYNEESPYGCKYCYGKTPWQTFQQSEHLAKNKMLDEIGLTKWGVV